MPISQGTIALTMFRADPAELKKLTFDSLQRFTILPLEGADDKAVGFAPLADPLARYFDGERNHPDIGEYTAFCLRIDTKRIPGAVLKKHLHDALEKEAERNRKEGKKFVSRERKREIKEQVKIRLLAKTEAVPATHEIVISKDGVVYLGSNSNTVIDAVRERFAACFQCNLMELQQEEFFLSNLREQGFLTQLVKEGCKTGDAELFATGSVTVANEDTTLTGISKSDSDIQAIHAAVKDGMQVTKTGVQINTDDGQRCTLTMTPLLRISGMKLPATERGKDDDDPDASFLERMYLLEKYTGIIVEAFKNFSKNA